MKRNGFSLIEVLVATSILAVLSVLLFNILGGVLKIWTAGNQNSELYQSARSVVEIMGRELSIAEPLPSQMQGNFKSFASSPLVINPPLPGTFALLKDTTGAPMDSIFFYSPLKSSNKGPLVCTGYFLSSDYSLKRVAVAATNTTYVSMAADNLKVYYIWSAAPANALDGRTIKYSEFIQPAGWLNPSTGNGVLQASTDKNVTSTLAERVLGIIIRPIGKDGNPLPSSLLPSTAPSSTSGTPITRAYNSSWWPVVDALPTEIEITLVFCEANAFNRLLKTNSVPILTMPVDNSDAAVQSALDDLKSRLRGKVNQYVVISKRFPLVRGSR